MWPAPSTWSTSSGLDYRLHAMGTVVEGDVGPLLDLLKRCVEAMATDCDRVTVSAKLDYRKGHAGALDAKVASVEKQLGRAAEILTLEKPINREIHGSRNSSPMTSDSDPVAQAFAKAVAHHRAGRLSEAEGHYRQVLDVESAARASWNLLGVVQSQSGHAAPAMEYIRAVIGAGCELGRHA